jgi:replicative DNA helicase
MDERGGDHKSLMFTPAEISTAYVEYVESLHTVADAGLTWGVKSMDDAIIPLKPGDVVGIIARPGHGKSTLAAYFAKRTAARIAAEGKQSERCAVFCTFEQTVEECETFFQADRYTVTDLAWGKVPMDLVRNAAVRRVELPIWLMGKSLIRRKRTPRMTLDVIYRAIHDVEEDFGGIRPALVVIDYIQIVPVEKARERVEQVGEAIVRAKELAGDVGAPVIVCVQASRSVDGYKAKIPAASDCLWASAIEQAADKLLGIWRPCLTEDTPAGEDIVINGRRVQMSQSLFVAKLLKQRWASAGHVFLLHFDPAAVKLADLELGAELESEDLPDPRGVPF